MRSVFLLERPGWEEVRKTVDRMIAEGYTYAEIVRVVNESGGAPSKLHVSTLQRYHARKYDRQRRIYEQARINAEAALEVLRKYGEPNQGELVRIRLVEAFLANEHKLANADPIRVGWLQVQYEHVAQQREQLANQKRELELKLKAIEDRAAAAKRAVEEALSSAKELDEETKRRIREEVYGIAA